MKPTFQRVALAAVLGLGLVVSAAAQDHGSGPSGPPGPRGGDRQKLFEDMQHRREQRLRDLLQIKPDQETAFRTFVSSLEQLRPERRLHADAPGGRAALTTPERLDRAAQRLAEAQQRLQKASVAVKTFYAALSPEQRKAFDEMPLVSLARNEGFGRRAMLMPGRFEGMRLR